MNWMTMMTYMYELWIYIYIIIYCNFCPVCFDNFNIFYMHGIWHSLTTVSTILKAITRQSNLGLYIISCFFLFEQLTYTSTVHMCITVIYICPKFSKCYKPKLHGIGLSKFIFYRQCDQGDGKFILTNTDNSHNSSPLILYFCLVYM